MFGFNHLVVAVDKSMDLCQTTAGKHIVHTHTHTHTSMVRSSVQLTSAVCAPEALSTVLTPSRSTADSVETDQMDNSYELCLYLLLDSTHEKGACE